MLFNVALVSMRYESHTSGAGRGVYFVASDSGAKRENPGTSGMLDAQCFKWISQTSSWRCL